MLSAKARGLTPYTAGEQPRDKKYIKLNTNENPYPPSSGTATALKNFDIADLRLYPDPDCNKLKDAIAEYEKVDKENVFIGNGSDEVLAHAFAALFDASRILKFADITYSFYEVYAALYDLPFERIPTLSDFTLSCNDYYGDCNAVIANPNAPTGIGIASEDMETLIKNVKGNVIVDEAYIDFATVASSCVPLTQKYPHLLVVKTFSKSYSLAGIRCGYAIGNPDLIKGLETLKNSFNSYPVDAVCQRVCTAAVEDTVYYRTCAQRVKDTRARTAVNLSKLGYPSLPSDANFLFVKCRSGGAGLYEFLKQRGILVRYWNKPRIGDYVRITVGTDKEMDALIREIMKFEMTK